MNASVFPLCSKEPSKRGPMVNWWDVASACFLREHCDIFSFRFCWLKATTEFIFTVWFQTVLSLGFCLHMGPSPAAMLPPQNSSCWFARIFTVNNTAKACTLSHTHASSLLPKCLCRPLVDSQRTDLRCFRQTVGRPGWMEGQLENIYCSQCSEVWQKHTVQKSNAQNRTPEYRFIPDRPEAKHWEGDDYKFIYTY